MPNPELHIPGQNENRSLKGLLKVITTLALGFIALVGSFALVISYQTHHMKRPVGKIISDNFPLVAFFDQSPSGSFKVQALTSGELDEFKKIHPDCFFQMPPNGEVEMRKQLAIQASQIDAEIAKQYHTGRRMHVTASIEREYGGYQEWRVRLHHGNDHVNIGYYRAKQNSFVPTFHENYFGPALVFKGCLPLLLIFGILLFLIIKGVSLIPFFKKQI